MPNTVGIAMVVVVGVGFLLFLVGFSTPSWVQGTVNDITLKDGLWQACVGPVCTTLSTNPSDLPGWFTATRAMECIGFICYVALGVAVILTVFAKQKPALMATKILGIVAFFLIIIGAAIFGGESEVTDNLHYSFALTIIGGIVALAVSIMAFVYKPED